MTGFDAGESHSFGARARAVLAETARSVSSVFANPRLRRVQLALLTSLVGDLAYATAVTVWAYETGGAAAVGVFTAVRLATAAVTAPVGAAMADRYSRRATLLVTDGVRAVLVTAAAVCLLVGVTSPWPVYVLATLAGVLAAPFRSAQRAWMPALVTSPQELTASNATSGTLESVAVFAGPALGGLLVLATGVPTVFLLNVATFGVSMLLVLGVRATPSAAPALPAPAGAGPGVLGELAAGFRLVGGDPDLRLVTGQVCAQTFVGGAAKVFLVVLAVEVLHTGAGGVGLLDALLGIGSVVGGLVALARAARQRLGHDLTVGVLLWSVPLLLIVVWPSPVAVLVSLLVVGAANPLVDVNLDTIVQRLTPEHLMARVFGALDACYIATGALGSLAMAPLVGWLGLRWSIAVVAVPVALVAAASLRRMTSLDARFGAPEGLGLVQGVPWFAPLAPAVLESLARSLHRADVAAGEVVVAEGDVADRFYLVESGRVEVTRAGRPLREQHAGDFFGEIGLLHDVPRTATVIATEPTTLRWLDREAFLAAVTGRHRHLAEHVAETRIAFEG